VTDDPRNALLRFDVWLGAEGVPTAARDRYVDRLLVALIRGEPPGDDPAARLFVRRGPPG
jgi:hypothetical protein